MYVHLFGNFMVLTDVVSPCATNSLLAYDSCTVSRVCIVPSVLCISFVCGGGMCGCVSCITPVGYGSCPVVLLFSVVNFPFDRMTLILFLCKLQIYFIVKLKGLAK